MTKAEGNDAEGRAPGAGEDTGSAPSTTIEATIDAGSDGAGDDTSPGTAPETTAETGATAEPGAQTGPSTSGDSPSDDGATGADPGDHEAIASHESVADTDDEQPSATTTDEPTTDDGPAPDDEAPAENQPAPDDEPTADDGATADSDATATDGTPPHDEPTSDDGEPGTAPDTAGHDHDGPPPSATSTPSPPTPEPALTPDAPATMEVPAITLEPSPSGRVEADADTDADGTSSTRSDGTGAASDGAAPDSTDAVDAALPPVPLSALERLAQAFAREDPGPTVDDAATPTEAAVSDAPPDTEDAAAPSTADEPERGPTDEPIPLGPGRPAPTAPPVVQAPATEEFPAVGPPAPATGKPPVVEEAEEAEGTEEKQPAHAAPQRPATPLQQILAPVRALPVGARIGAAVLLGVLLLLVAWGIDTAVLHGSSVHRNVEVAGAAVGGQSSDRLDTAVAELAAAVESRSVTLTVDGEPLEAQLTPQELGISVDRDAASEDAWNVGRGDALPLRPLAWAGSLFSERTVSLEYEVVGLQAFARIQEVYQGAMDDGQVVPVVEPEVRLEGGEFVAVAGTPGQGLDPDQVLSDLQAALEASESTPDEPVTLEVETTELAPGITDTDAEGLADEINQVTAPLTVEVGDTERELSSEQLRSWVTPTVSTAELGWELDGEAAGAAVAELFADLSRDPTNARPRLANGEIEVVPSENGRRCCSDDTGERLAETMESGENVLVLEFETVDPEHSTEDVEDMGIVEPVGGNRGWQAGADVEGPRPGFTTWEVGGGGRAHNIGTIAEEVNGAWIPPGGTWSINDHVGVRECPPYQFGGAIVEGEHVDVCGGGISQFGTTMLNAAYFAGLDISGFRAHSEYFSRYPRGREATMGTPGGPLDVVLTNNTPYGVYIQSARHGDELTVTLWSTQHIEVEQTGISESHSGECTYVTTTRTRTYPDGSTEEDTFSGAYGPGGEVRC